MDLGAEGMFFDAGDIEPLPGTEMFLLIEDSIRTLLSDNLAPICLGGDHSITYPIIRAVSKKYPDLNILHFDAHPDLYDELWEIAIPTQARLPESWKRDWQNDLSRLASVPSTDIKESRPKDLEWKLLR